MAGIKEQKWKHMEFCPGSGKIPHDRMDIGDGVFEKGGPDLPFGRQQEGELSKRQRLALLSGTAPLGTQGGGPSSPMPSSA